MLDYEKIFNNESKKQEIELDEKSISILSGLNSPIIEEIINISKYFILNKKDNFKSYELNSDIKKLEKLNDDDLEKIVDESENIFTHLINFSKIFWDFKEEIYSKIQKIREFKEVEKDYEDGQKRFIKPHKDWIEGSHSVSNYFMLGRNLLPELMYGVVPQNDNSRKGKMLKTKIMFDHFITIEYWFEYGNKTAKKLMKEILKRMKLVEIKDYDVFMKELKEIFYLMQDFLFDERSKNPTFKEMYQYLNPITISQRTMDRICSMDEDYSKENSNFINSMFNLIQKMKAGESKEIEIQFKDGKIFVEEEKKK